MSANTPQQQKDLDDRYMHAVLQGDFAGVKAALAGGANIEAQRNKDSGNMLLVALYNSKSHIADYLLEQGINVNTRGFSSATPLMLSVSRQDVALTKTLLEHGANPNWPEMPPRPQANSSDAPGLWPMHQACIYGNKEAVELLLEAGADFSVCARNGGSPLWYAAANNRADVVCLLINEGADPEAPFTNNRLYHPPEIEGEPRPKPVVVKDYKSGLHHPTSSNHHEIVKILLDAGADANAPDQNGRSPLEYADQWPQHPRAEVKAVYERYAQYPVFDVASLDTLTKADLFATNEHGYCLMDSPSTWKNHDAIAARLQQQGEPLGVEDLVGKNKDGITWLQRGAECFAPRQVFEYCQQKEGKLSLDYLLDKNAQASGLLNTLIDRGQLPHLVSPTTWKNNRAEEFRLLYNALPEEAQEQVGNFYLLYHSMRAEENKRENKGIGRA